MTRRSSQPPLWLLFGAGGMLSALVGAALVVVTGLAAPLGWGGAAEAMDYARLHAFARHAAGAFAIFLLVSLFLWHAAHRIFHTLHDLGLHAGRVAWAACYGTAIAGTLAAAMALAWIGGWAFSG